MTSETLGAYREKWREVPGGSSENERLFSTDLLALPSADMLAHWEEQARRRAAGDLAWRNRLYLDVLRGKRVLELGSGLGYDGLHFVESAGAHWTFADIVPDNLEVIRRVAGARGFGAQTAFHYIGDDLSFDALGEFDAIWVSGSIHHVPFEIQHREAMNVMPHLVPGGRWLELVYPRERWLLEGEQPFSSWGRSTDGDRTPWVEWFDAEKIRARLAPARFEVLLDFEFGASEFRWVDLRYAEPHAFDPARAQKPLERVVTGLADRVQIDPSAQRLPFAGGRLRTQAELWARGATLDLAGAIAELAPLASGRELALDLEVEVDWGAFVLCLSDRAAMNRTGGAAVAAARPWRQRVTLRGASADIGSLLVRNYHAGRRSIGRIVTATLRLGT